MRVFLHCRKVNLTSLDTIALSNVEKEIFNILPRLPFLQKLVVVRYHNRSDGMEVEIKLRVILIAQLELEKERFDSYH